MLFKELALLALATGLNADKLPWTDYDPSLFDSWKFVNTVASDVALLLCEDNENYIKYVNLSEKKWLVNNDEKAYTANVNIKFKKEWEYKKINKKYKSHIDRHNMWEIITTTTNLEREFRIYKDKINNALNYIWSKKNPCKAALEYAKYYKVVDENHKLKINP